MLKVVLTFVVLYLSIFVAEAKNFRSIYIGSGSGGVVGKKFAQSALNQKVSDVSKDSFEHGYGALFSFYGGMSWTAFDMLYMAIEGSYYLTSGMETTSYGKLQYSGVGHLGLAFNDKTAVYLIGGVASAAFVNESGASEQKLGIQYGLGLKQMVLPHFAIALEVTGNRFDVNSDSVALTNVDFAGMRNIFGAQVKFEFHL